MALTLKQRKFITAYLGEANGNATKAAELAGYKAGRASLAEIGRQNLRKLEITAEIQRLYAEIAMPAEEIIGRLTQQAQGIGDAIKDDHGYPSVNLERLRETGRMHLVKGIKYNPKGQPIIEFYDAQAALTLLAKHRGLCVDRQEVTGKDGGPIRHEFDFGSLTDVELDERLARAEAGEAGQDLSSEP